MSKKDEALKLALEALENSVDLVMEEARQAQELYGSYPPRQARVQGLQELAKAHQSAITAAQEALTEQDDPDLQDKDPELVAPAQQQSVERGEPVADRQLSLAMRQWDHWKAYALELQEKLVKYEGGAPMVLNTSPPAQDNSDDLTIAYMVGFNAGKKEQPAQQKPVAWISRTGHGTYFRESITHGLEALEFGGNKMWTPLYECPQPAQQREPVAWGFQNTAITGSNRWMMLREEIPANDQYGGALWTPLYTSPPQSKSWVGLTDDEFQFIYDNGNTPAEMMEMVEVKLKEKNT